MDDDRMETDDGGGGASAENLFRNHGALAHEDWNTREILEQARELINQGNPSLALQAVMTVMRLRGGEEALVATLNRACEIFRTRLEENSAADDLTSLLAKCAIAEANPAGVVAVADRQANLVGPLMDAATESSILALGGRRQVMLDAFADGSSFVCQQCGGLVSNQRREEHSEFWCGRT